MRLKNNGMMPGGLQFIDPRAGGMKWTDTHTGLGERIQQVIKFRRNNPQIYNPVTDGAAFDFEQVGNEIINFNCSRIGNDPNWCYDQTKSQMNVGKPTARPVDNKCSNCGCQLVPRHCKTCAGAKIIGYDCPQCKKSY